MTSSKYKLSILLFGLILFLACSENNRSKITLVEGPDTSAGVNDCYIIKTANATYYLEKNGGGLSSMVDADGVDWLGFHSASGSAHKGEYRGFPNAIHKQDGSYFHAMNAKTDSSICKVLQQTDQHIRIGVTSKNKQWEALWDFYPDRCDFTMQKISPGHHYWVQYEGVPGGDMDTTDYWYCSADTGRHEITEHYEGDLPSPEWIAFGDQSSTRTFFMLHHTDDEHPDNYEDRADMTVFAFGREQKNKFLNTKQKFSIGFVESTKYIDIEQTMERILQIK